MDLAIPLGGMNTAAAAVDQSARQIAKSTTSMSNALVASAPGSPAPQADTVDLSAEMVALMQAKNAFAANVNVARTEDAMTQSLLNILA